MVHEDMDNTIHQVGSFRYGSSENLATSTATSGCCPSHMACCSSSTSSSCQPSGLMKINEFGGSKAGGEFGSASFKMPYQQSFRADDWSQLAAEVSLPLKTSNFYSVAARREHSSCRMADHSETEHSNLPLLQLLLSPQLNGAPTTYGGTLNGGLVNSSSWSPPPPPSRRPLLSNSYNPIIAAGVNSSKEQKCAPLMARESANFETSYEQRSRLLTRKLIIVNLISLVVNLILALVAFYFSFANNGSSTTAFAADCLLDLISSAIVLWRYYGDLSDVYMHAREQIACIYLGALFELSALGIIIKASSDIALGVDLTEPAPGYDLIYLATAASIACSILIVFKYNLYQTIRDKSILLDVINTFVSTIFAVTLCLMTVLSNVDSSFWYFDPILSIALALFMAAFGLKVIHQNFHVLRPGYNDYYGSSESLRLGGSPFAKLPLLNTRDDERMGLVGADQRARCARPGARDPAGQFEINLNNSVENGRVNWQKTDYSSIAFV